MEISNDRHLVNIIGFKKSNVYYYHSSTINLKQRRYYYEEVITIRIHIINYLFHWYANHLHCTRF